MCMVRLDLACQLQPVLTVVFLLHFGCLFLLFKNIASAMRKMTADNMINSPPPTVRPTISSTRLGLSSLRTVPTPGVMNGVATGLCVVGDEVELRVGRV